MITWNNPASIVYGTALSATQLNATASVAGTFAYTPAAGTIPVAGTDTLSVTFTPTDTTDYTSVTKTVTLTVTQAAPVITWNNPGEHRLRHGTLRYSAECVCLCTGHSRLYACRWHRSDSWHGYALGHLYSDRHHQLLHGHRNRPAHRFAGCSGDHVE